MDDDVVWNALADKTRRKILDLLRPGAKTTGEVAEAIGSESGLSRFAVMKHLGVLVDAGLVSVQREGRVRWNSLNAAPFVALYRRWVSPFAALPGAALFDLKSYVEKQEEEP